MTEPITTPETPAPRDPAGPGTQEIGVGTTATVTGTHQLPRVDAEPPAGGVRPTGPIEGVQPPGRTGHVHPTGPVGPPPGLPGAATPPPADTSRHPLGAPHTPEAARPARSPRTPRRPRTPRAPRSPRPAEERAVRVGTGLTALSLLLLQVGLAVGFGEVSLWSAVTLWSVFATLAALLGALPYAGRFVPAARLRPDAAWKVAAGGLTGVAVFWVLVVLPRVDSDRGFVLTAALAALGAALWVAPGRGRD